MTIETDAHIGEAINRTMQYFALFRYPLNVHDIWQYCGVSCSKEDIMAFLEEQQVQGKVFGLHGYFSLVPEIDSLLERRIKGNEKALREMKNARRVGRLIYQFPFVRFVGISGSLSKGYSDEHSDYDFFIITRKDRLWIARTLLHILKKLSFVIGQQHKLCMNYFIDESALQLQEVNLYTATELNSLIPVSGKDMHRQLMEANAWVKRFLPNYTQDVCEPANDGSWLIKGFTAGIINMMNPDGLNRLLMNLTNTKWQKKWSKKGYPKEDYDLAFKTRINISKNHRLNYQKKVLSALRLKEE